MFTTLIRGLLTLAAIALSFPAWSQPWPSKPIRVFVAQGAGGGQDTLTRYLMERLSASLGQQIIVENRPGAGGTIGTRAAATAPADGYNFLIGSTAALASGPYTVKALPYDPIKDFIPIALISKPGFLIVANANLPVKTLADVVAMGKTDPGKLTTVIDGSRNASGMVAGYLNKVSGANLTLVPYSNMRQGLQDTVAGTTGLFIQSAGFSMPFIKTGALRPIAVSSLTRDDLLPDTPTVAETYPGFSLVGWLIVAAPAGTPADIVERMNREFDVILKNPEVVEWMRNFGSPTAGGAGKLSDLNEFVRSELAVWEKVVRTIGLEPE